MRRPAFYLLTLFFLPVLLLGQELPPDTLISLETVEISDQNAQDQETFTRGMVPRETLEELPLKDIGSALRTVPNVNGVRKGAAVSDPVVRGFKYSQLNVDLNNGQKIEGGCPNRMDPAVAHVDVDDIEKLEVLKGPHAFRYGPNFGGVVRMETRRPQLRKKFGVNVGALMGYESNWDGYKNSLSIDGGNDKVFFGLSGNMKKYGNYEDGDGREVSSGFERYNYSAQLGIVPFHNSTLRLSYDQSYGKDIMFPALPMDEREDDTRLLSLDFEALKISPHFNSFTAKFYISDVNHLMDNKQRPFSDTVVAVSDIIARNYGFRVDGEFRYGANELVIGADYQHILKDGTRTKTRILEPGMPVMSEDLWNDAQIQNSGLFLLYGRLFGKLRFDAAARIDLNSANSGEMKLEKMGNVIYSETDVSSFFVNLSASLDARYHFSDRFSLGLAIGRGVRSPDMNERFIILLPVGYDNYDYLGNPDLRPEINNEADLSARLVLSGAGTLEGGFFFSYVQDYITGELVPESVARPQTKGVYGVKRFSNEDYVYLRGFEISYSTPGSLKWGVSAWAACTRGINPEATVYIVENGEVTGSETIKNDPLPEIPPLEGNLDVHYRFFEGRLVPRIHLRMVATQKQLSEAYMEEETPGFMLLSANISYTFNKFLKITAGANNILDKAYYEHLNRRIIGSNGKLYEPGRSFYINLYFNI